MGDEADALKSQSDEGAEKYFRKYKSREPQTTLGGIRHNQLRQIMFEATQKHYLVSVLTVDYLRMAQCRDSYDLECVLKESEFKAKRKFAEDFAKILPVKREESIHQGHKFQVEGFVLSPEHLAAMLEEAYDAGYAKRRDHELPFTGAKAS